MCGISGAVSTDPGTARSGLHAQLACQHHRGPDGQGHFAGGRGVIAHNRLAIIDAAQGADPVTNEDHTVGAVLNGEIYNFQLLRDELRRAGHTLATRGDTEVIAHLAEGHDPVSIARALDGMFAFAAWDRAGEQLILGRDRTGKKPLYYWRSAETFVFASEIKGVLAHPAVPCQLDDRAISAYLTFGYVPTPDTFFAGIKSLPPAHVLTLEPGGDPVIERYWQLGVPGVNQIVPAELEPGQAAEEVRAHLQDAVRRRLVADVPIGALLSGGVDSSAIVALMTEAMSGPVKTFSIGFEDSAFDERPFARSVAKRFGTDHHELVVRPDAMELAERLVLHHDQPFGDASAIPTFLLSEVAHQDVTVALSGDGGDELFGGYPRFAAGVAAQRVLSLPPAWRHAARRAADVLPGSGLGGRVERGQRFAATVEQGMPWAYLDWISYVPESWRRRLLSEPGDEAREVYASIWSETAGARPLDRLLALNFQTYLPDDLLVKLDRTSMAHGLEVRCPFLDTQLLEFASALAPALKVRGLSLKRVLKQAVADLLPEEILGRQKRGFGVPLDRWFREDLEGFARSMLGSGGRVRAHVNGAVLDQLLAEHRSGAEAHGYALWTLLTLELFLRRHGW